MSQISEVSGDSESYILVAKMDNARNLTNLLKAIHFKDIATVYLSENGLKITVEDSKYVQASAFVQVQMFQEYSFTEEEGTFQINLAVMLECLNIFGSSKDSGTSTALKMCYAGHGSPLKLMLVEDAGILTDCSIKTQDTSEVLDFDFQGDEVENKIIMKSIALKDTFAELDMTSDAIQIMMSPDAPFFRISTFGYCGSSHTDFPKDSDLFELFECNQTQTNNARLTRKFAKKRTMMMMNDRKRCYPNMPKVQYTIKREKLDEPSKDVEFWPDATHVCGGRDLTLSKEGGTWLGMNIYGQIGTLTNYRSKQDFLDNGRSDKLSRGNIVSNYLINCSKPDDYINGLIHGKDSYSPFNVLLGQFEKDAGFEFVYGNNIHSELSEIIDDDVVHGLSNSQFDCTWTKVELGKKIFSEIITEDLEKDDLVEKLFSLLENDTINFPNHGGSDLHLPKEVVPYASSIFVKMPAKYKYGTRTSTVIVVDENKSVTYVEKTMSDPMNFDDPKWKTSKLEFDIQTEKEKNE
eukprot:gene14017-15474_t